ncbi:helix-turn-helix transcriptional regulator [Sulfurimonas sp.]|uniref:S24 family peptidase n=1 Tax=Sulfurimonas sp. TaxID=2022749 RepID=UPI00356ADC12
MSLITLEYVDALDSNNEKKVLEFSVSLLKEPINKGSLFVIKVDGESMEPVIKDCTLVVADLSQREVVDAGIYLVYYENKMWIKKAKQESDGMTFVSINKAYSHLVYKEEEVRVVAKAVLSFNSL